MSRFTYDPASRILSPMGNPRDKNARPGSLQRDANAKLFELFHGGLHTQPQLFRGDEGGPISTAISQLLAPPQGEGPKAHQIVQQLRQLTGLPVNNRSNSIVVDPTAGPVGGSSTLPMLQLNGVSDDTDMLTIMLGFAFATPLPNPVGILNFNTAIQALVTWGVGNVQNVTKVDWGHGTLLSLPANYLSVSAIVPTTPPQAGVPLLKLSAAVAYGVALPHANRARLTVEIGSIANNTIVGPFPVPDFATGFTMASSAGQGAPFGGPPVTPINIRFRNDSATDSWWDFQYNTGGNTGGQNVGTFNVPPGANEFLVGNTSGGTAPRVTVFFDITI